VAILSVNADLPGPLAFGSVDSPNPLLSSSPAAPSLIGGHLSNSVQSFGSLPADTSSATPNQDPRKPTMTTATPQAPAKKPLDPHSFFMAKPKAAAATQSQQSQQPQAQQSQSQQPQSQQSHQGQHPQSHMSSPPPTMNGHPMGQPQGQFRPSSSQSMMQQGQMRPNGAPYGQQRPMGMNPGMPHYQQHPGAPYNMGYPGPPQYAVSLDSFYSTVADWQYQGNYDHQQQFPQWQQQMHQQQHQQRPPHSGFAMSPRGSSSGLPQGQPSPAPPSAQLPTNGSISPAPGAPSNRSSFMAPSPSAGGQSGTPSRPISQPSVPPFVPSQAPPYMSATASTFTPRKSAAIQIKRPDGTALELASAKSTTPEPTAVAPTPARPKSSTPVPIKMESEEGRKARLAEEAEKERLKKEGDKSEQDKKDLKEREAKEAEEKRVAEEAAKAKEESVSTARLSGSNDTDTRPPKKLRKLPKRRRRRMRRLLKRSPKRRLLPRPQRKRATRHKPTLPPLPDLLLRLLLPPIPPACPPNPQLLHVVRLLSISSPRRHDPLTLNPRLCSLPSPSPIFHPSTTRLRSNPPVLSSTKMLNQASSDTTGTS